MLSATGYHPNIRSGASASTYSFAMLGRGAGRRARQRLLIAGGSTVGCRIGIAGQRKGTRTVDVNTEMPSTQRSRAGTCIYVFG